MIKLIDYLIGQYPTTGGGSIPDGTYVTPTELTTTTQQLYNTIKGNIIAELDTLDKLYAKTQENDSTLTNQLNIAINAAVSGIAGSAVDTALEEIRGGISTPYDNLLKLYDFLTTKITDDISTVRAALEGGADSDKDTLKKVFDLLNTNITALSTTTTAAITTSETNTKAELRSTVPIAQDNLKKIYDWVVATYATATAVDNAVTTLKGGATSSHDTLKKLYDLFTTTTEKFTVADTTARDALTVTLGAQVFVQSTDGTPGHWALYRADSAGTGVSFTQLSNYLTSSTDPETIATAYESVSDVERFTTALKTSLETLVIDIDDKVDKNGTDRLMTLAEGTKLSEIQSGATVNDTDANLKNRANHTGTQSISTITGLDAILETIPDTLNVDLAGLVKTDTTEITASFTILEALGSLQAQITELRNQSALAGYPPIVTTFQAWATEDIPLPDYLVPIIDNTYGYPMKITRIMDIGIGGAVAGSTALSHGYSKTQYWNADQTLMKLNQKTLLNGSTYAYIKSLTAVQGTSIWSNVRPSIVYDFTGNLGQIREIDVNTNTIVRTVIDFPSLGWSNKVSLGNGEGDISKDDKYAVVITTQNDGIDRYCVCNLHTGEIESVRTQADLGLVNGEILDWIGISQSGNYIQGSWTGGTAGAGGKRIFDRNWNLITLDQASNTSHADMGFDILGNEVRTGAGHFNYKLLSENPGIYRRLVTSENLTLAFNNVNQIGGHTSCRNLNLPGWVYISVTSSNSDARDLAIMSLKLKDPSLGMEARMWCPHRRVGTSYNTEPQNSPSRDGKRVLFTSNWNDIANTVGWAFVVECP